jgi:hypothetical protein
MVSRNVPTLSSKLRQVPFHLLSLGAGLTLAIMSALAIESAEQQSQSSARHRSPPTAAKAIAIPTRPPTNYYIVSSAPSLVIPQEAIDIEQGWIPSNVTVHFRVVNSPESELQLLDELDWQVQNGRLYQVFDTR